MCRGKVGKELSSVLACYAAESADGLLERTPFKLCQRISFFPSKLSAVVAYPLPTNPNIVGWILACRYMAHPCDKAPSIHLSYLVPLSEETLSNHKEITQVAYTTRILYTVVRQKGVMQNR